MMFIDRFWEDIGSRQCKWLDYLQYHSNEPIKATNEYNGRYTQWMPYNWGILPISHRQILPNEDVIEFDGKKRDENYACSRRIWVYLKNSNIPHYLEDHNGKSPHIHIFGMSEDERRDMFKRAKIGDYDKQLKTGHMIREIGGRYKDTQFYSSAFPTFDDIQPVTQQNAVNFPKINLNRQNGRKEEGA
jgi:hypothetical protein